MKKEDKSFVDINDLLKVCNKFIKEFNQKINKVPTQTKDEISYSKLTSTGLIDCTDLKNLESIEFSTVTDLDIHPKIQQIKNTMKKTKFKIINLEEISEFLEVEDIELKDVEDSQIHDY